MSMSFNPKKVAHDIANGLVRLNPVTLLIFLQSPGNVENYCFVAPLLKRNKNSKMEDDFFMYEIKEIEEDV